MTKAIDSYQFGEIVINGDSYQSDVIILPSRVITHWQRKKGHQLSPEDLEEIIGEKPEVLIIGTGAYGEMKVPSETQGYLKAQGIEFITKTTNEACQLYNQLRHSGEIVAVLHLTC